MDNALMHIASDGAAAALFDVAIVGGGPAGCATAIALAQAGVRRVLLVEATDYRTVRIGESIPPTTARLLQRLGLWDAFVAERHQPCLGSCSAWGSTTLGYNDSLFNALGPGWHLDRARFDAWLAAQAAERGTEIWRRTRLEACKRGTAGFVLTVARDGRAPQLVAARVVVDATGVRSAVARRLGARRRTLDELLCVIQFFTLPAASEMSQLTLLEAAPDGWWYAAKLPDRHVAVAFAGEADFIKQAGMRARDRFLAALAATEHVAAQVSDCRPDADAPIACAAPSFILEPIAGEGWLAVGDAACAYDPISSQGIHKALTDGLAAAGAIAAARRGSPTALAGYRGDQAARFGRYCATRSHFYGLERRWPASPFWRARQARAALAPA
jgi:flavin-dependent dehydrogenase